MMDKLEWRSGAKVVGVVDAVFIAISCLILIALCAGAIIFIQRDMFRMITPKISENSYNDIKGSKEMTDAVAELKGKIERYFFVGTALNLVQTLAVWSLLVACRPNRKAFSAVVNAYIWVVIRIIYTLITFIPLYEIWQSPFARLLWLALGSYIWTVIAIYTVLMFIFEIQTTPEYRQEDANPDAVVVDADAD